MSDDSDHRCFDTLGVRLQLSGPAPLLADIADQLSDLIDTERTDGAADHVAVVLTGQDRLPDALAKITAAAVSASPLFCVHAGVVLTATGVLAIPGPSGIGKSTLTTALVQAGLWYVSDETLAVDRRTREVARFPRPIGLSPRTWAMLGIDATPGPDEAERLFAPRLFGRIAPAATAGRTVGDIVLPYRRPGGPTLERADRAEAVRTLLDRSFNHYAAPESSFHTAVALARGARVWRAGYAEAAELAALLHRELGAPGLPAQDAATAS